MEKKNIYTGAAVAAVIAVGGMFLASSVRDDSTLAPAENSPVQETKESETLYVFAGPTWVWERTEMKSGEIVRPEAGKEKAFTLRFDSAKGAVSGTTDCNGFGGEYTAGAANRLSFGPFISTLMFCEGSQEADFRKMIEQSRRYFFTEDGNLVLVMENETGTIFLGRI